MQPKKLRFILPLTLAILLMFSVSALAEDTSVIEETTIWELKETSVVDPGQTVETAQGTLTMGYTLEAIAKSKSGDLVRDGSFRLTLSAFSPKKDLPGQEKGLWYIQGSWTVVNKYAQEGAEEVRHNPYKVDGNIQAVLTFNPAVEKKNWSAKAWLPMSLAAGQWAQGDEGSLTLDAAYEGTLFLPLELWSKAK